MGRWATAVQYSSLHMHAASIVCYTVALLVDTSGYHQLICISNNKYNNFTFADLTRRQPPVTACASAACLSQCTPPNQS